MNAILQCLTHTPLLTNYFHAGLYKHHANAQAIASPKGYFAELVADFFKAYTDGVEVPAALKKIKEGVAFYIPQFQGYDQHDAQEVSPVLN